MGPLSLTSNNVMELGLFLLNGLVPFVLTKKCIFPADV